MIDKIALAYMMKLAVSWEKKFTPDIEEKKLQSTKVVSNFSGLGNLINKPQQKQAEFNAEDVEIQEWLKARKKARAGVAMKDMNILAKEVPHG